MSAGATATDGTPTTGSTMGGASTDVLDTTTVASTTGGTTMALPDPTGWTTNDGDDTTEGFVCNWFDEPDGKNFCPLATGANANIAGMTPVGPIAFKFAYFGLGPCLDCPQAVNGSLVFYGEAEGPTKESVDLLRVSFFIAVGVSVKLGDKESGFNIVEDEQGIIVSFTDVDVPSVAETNPPLDPDAPPTLSGKLTIVGGGWDVSGSFTASLCRPVDLGGICD